MHTHACSRMHMDVCLSAHTQTHTRPHAHRLRSFESLALSLPKMWRQWHPRTAGSPTQSHLMRASHGTVCSWAHFRVAALSASHMDPSLRICSHRCSAGSQQQGSVQCRLPHMRSSHHRTKQVETNTTVMKKGKYKGIPSLV